MLTQYIVEFASPLSRQPATWTSRCHSHREAMDITDIILLQNFNVEDEEKPGWRSDDEEEAWETASDHSGDDQGEETGASIKVSCLGWAHLPLMLLEQVYLHLTVRQRYEASRVCWWWYIAFRSPRIWRHLLVNENTFTYLRHTLYSGHHKVISHHQEQLYLARIGRHIRRITIEHMADFFNLYEFVKVLLAFIRFFDDYPMKLLKCFEFEFACELRTHSETMVFGTGGQMLEEIKELLSSFRGLEILRLNHLLLQESDAPGLLEKIQDHCGHSLRKLEVLNACKVYFPHFYVGMFPNLRELTISPSQLSDDVVLMLGNHRSLGEIVIVQDKYTCPCDPVSERAWTEFRSKSPSVRVRLEVRGCMDNDVLIQPNAPVHAVVYKSPHACISARTLLQVMDNYKKTLKVYGHCLLPRKFGSKSFHERPDSYLVMMAKCCPKLETLVIRERISSTTLLIIASHARNLRRLCVRRNALLKRFDWPQAPQWTGRFYEWLGSTAKSEAMVEQEIAKLLGSSWKLLSDKWFKNVSI